MKSESEVVKTSYGAAWANLGQRTCSLPVVTLCQFHCCMTEVCAARIAFLLNLFLMMLLQESE